jgi:hypothetical protein
MSTLTAPTVTGYLRVDHYRVLREDETTGYECGDASSAWQILSNLWGLSGTGLMPTSSEQDDPHGLQGAAVAVAAITPHVASPLPQAPALTGNLAEDTHEVCGLTWRQIADVFQISERAVAGWRTQGVPRHRAQTMQVLRAIGATLVGGLGPAGVCAWLIAGQPSRLERVRDGEVEAVAADALSYLDTPAT